MNDEVTVTGTGEVNVPELRKVLEFVTAHPDVHDQEVWVDVRDAPRDAPERFERCLFGEARTPRHLLRDEYVWSCGTSACLAGWTALLAGWRPAYGDDQLVYRDDRVRHAEEVARERLGLSLLQADALFDPANSRRRLWRLAARFTDGAIRPPAELDAEPDRDD